MKKVIFSIIAVLLALVLSSCGSGDTPSEMSSTAPALSVASESSQDTTSSEMEKPSSALDEELASAPNAGTEPESEAGPTEEPGSHILVAYFSRMGNMSFDENVDATTSASVNLLNGEYVGNAQLLAQTAQETTEGDLFSIETVDKYPADYRETTNLANDEKSADTRPELATHVEGMGKYDTVVLIYPNWWGGLPQAVKTFLEEYDFSGKTIYPLCTHEGSGLSNTESEIAEFCPGATVSEGLSVRGGSAADAWDQVAAWLDGLKSSAPSEKPVSTNEKSVVYFTD